MVLEKLFMRYQCIMGRFYYNTPSGRRSAWNLTAGDDSDPVRIYFTIRSRFMPFRLFPEMIRVVTEKKTNGKYGTISGVQALIVSTATRVGMGNLVGVVAAISAEEQGLCSGCG